MKKGKIAALIVAAVFLITGGLLVFLGYISQESRPAASILQEREVAIQESFANVLVDTQDCDVTVVPCLGETTAKVAIKDWTNVSHNVGVEENTLRIEMEDSRDWKDHIGIRWESMKLTLYLPQKTYDSVNITTATGEIQIPDGFSAKSVTLRSDTGRIRCESAVSDHLECVTATGDIRVIGCTPEQLSLISGTGHTEVANIGQGGVFYVKNGTGSIILTDVNSRSLTVEINTGKTALERVVAKEQMVLVSDTGDIVLKDCDSAMVNIESDTGDVSGNFLTPKTFDAESDTGDVRVANTADADPCHIRTDTGDIYFD